MSMKENISVYEHCIRKLRYMRVTGASIVDQRRYADSLSRNLGIDANKALEAAKLPGEINGYPYLAKADDEHQARNAVP